MKVTVTHLKAGWPEGVQVGSVVEVKRDTLPACFVGKCVVADAEVEATHVYEPPAAQTSEVAAASAPGEIDALRQAKDTAEQAASEAMQLFQASQAELQAAQARIAELEASTGKPKGAR